MFLILSDDFQIEDVNECFATIGKLFNVAYYIVTVINKYLAVGVKYKTENGEENSKSKCKINEPFISKQALGKLNESVVYVIYLLSVLKSFNKNFKHVRI